MTKPTQAIEIKIKNIEHAIKQSQAIVKESNVNSEVMKFIKRKIAKSIIELEHLYMVREQQDN